MVYRRVNEKRKKDSPINGTSTSVEPAMSDRRDEPDLFLGSSSPDRLSENRSKLSQAGFGKELRRQPGWYQVGGSVTPPDSLSESGAV